MSANIKGAAKAAPTSPAMYSVRLNRAVPLHGIVYKPGQTITVNEATKAELGDAVEHAVAV
ncbi:hypothetical protein [Methylobacterium ajmalii]|uniref:hypothetical protein n=1 Tax=Methylobacterium ajmalii TaxID=2738439 RepID=UPI002F355A5E